MTFSAALAPLIRTSTYRRGVFLLLGGVILLPYVLLGVAFTQLLSSTTAPAVSLLLLAVALVIAATPAFLRGTVRWRSPPRGPCSTWTCPSRAAPPRWTGRPGSGRRSG